MDIYKYIKVNKTLNPKIWNGLVLKEEVKDKIQEIVDVFVNKIQNDNVPILVEDIWLLGSNAGYNYNSSSDLDIHLMVNLSLENQNSEYLIKLYDLYRSSFKNTYTPTIYKIPVELYVEEFGNSNNASEGIYSLNEGWIKKPKKEELNVNAKETEALYNSYVEEFYDMTEKISSEPVNYQIYEIEKFINKIYSLRGDKLTEGNEFYSGNIVFKELRAKGYINALRELKMSLENRKMTL